jgi:sugar lactone lactonase YvrE
MKPTRRRILQASLCAAATGYFISEASGQGTPPTPTWPPALQGAKNGTVTLRTDRFLEVPDAVAKMRQQEGAAAFTVAKEVPAVDLAFHGNLGENAIGRRLWSSWGDICLASNGKVYCGIGDHADDAGGDARCFLYAWDNAAKTLTQVVDMNRVVMPQQGQPAWSKVHAKIDEGEGGKIYFSCTLNDGNRAGNANFRWTERLPGGQLYQYDPEKRTTSVVTTLPGAPRCTATSLLDRSRNLWWCNLEVGGNALWCYDLAARKPVFQANNGTMGFNRNFALDRAGNVYFNGPENTLWKYDRAMSRIAQTKCNWGKSPGMRSSTRESRNGHIFGTAHQTGQLFRYTPTRDDLTLLGPCWMTGDYVTVAELSPDERFIYYLPGAHGQASRTGTPVIQYDIAAGRRKVIAFLARAFEQAHDYVPAGTYGVKISADGSTLYVNFNGHPTKNLPKHLRPNGFGLCAFAAIQIPRGER